MDACFAIMLTLMGYTVSPAVDINNHSVEIVQYLNDGKETNVYVKVDGVECKINKGQTDVE